MRDGFDDIRLRDFLFFERLAALGSLTQAAREMHLPRSTASRWLSEFEARVGETLFARTTRSVALTDAGRNFAAHVRAVLEASQSARLGVKAGAVGGTVRVAVPVPMGRVLTGRVIAEFREKLPGVRLEIRLQSEPVDLVRERFDVAIRAGALADSELRARRLSTASMWLYASARYRGEALEDTPFIAAPGDEALLRRVRAKGASRLTPAVRIDDRSAIADALLWGAGCGLLPSFLGETGRSEGALVRLLREPVAALPVHALYHPSKRNDARVHLLLDCFARQLERVL